MNPNSHAVYRFYSDIISAGDTAPVEELFTEDLPCTGLPALY